MRKVNLRNVDPAIDDPDASTWCMFVLNLQVKFASKRQFSTSHSEPSLAPRCCCQFQTPGAAPSPQTKKTRRPRATSHPTAPLRHWHGPRPPYRPFQRIPQTAREPHRTRTRFLCSWIFHSFGSECSCSRLGKQQLPFSPPTPHGSLRSPYVPPKQPIQPFPSQPPSYYSLRRRTHW
jgi:hypothetical protein